MDLTELIRTLRRTGIQRLERQLIRHWPGPAMLRPCWLDPRVGQLFTLPYATLSLLAAETPPGGPDAEARSLALLTARGQKLDASGVRLLNVELFFDPARIGLYTRLATQEDNKTHWLVYDFLPWLCPQFFDAGTPRAGLGFLRALRHAPHVAFISKEVRADYQNRITRNLGQDGPVLPLGGDGLGVERQTFASARIDFVWLSTIDPARARVLSCVDSCAYGMKGRMPVSL